MEEETVLSDIMKMPPEFYRFEIVNVLILIVVGIALIALTAFETIHIFLGVGLLAIMAGIASTASSANFYRTRSSGKLGGVVAKSFKYRIATGIVCYIAGGALLIAYLVR